MDHWLKNAIENLFSHSIEINDFLLAKREWLYTGVDERDDCDGDCELCGFSGLKFDFEITNQFNGNKMIVGSECIKKFINETDGELLDENGTLVDNSRLTEDMHLLHLKWVARILDEKYRRVGDPKYFDFHDSIAEDIMWETPLSPKQAYMLYHLYKDLTPQESAAFRDIVHINLRKQKNQMQLKSMGYFQSHFVSNLMTSQQRKKYNLQD